MAVNEAVNIQADGAAALLGEGPEQQAEGGQDDDQAQILALFIGLGTQVDPRQHREANGRGHDQGIHRPLLPEQHGNQQRRDDQQYQQPAPVGQQEAAGVQRLAVHAGGMLEMTVAAEENHQSRHHADGRQGKAHRPAILLLNVAAGDGRDDRADIARGIHQREAAIATRIGGFVQFAQQTADVGFKQPVAADDDRQRQVEEGRGGFAGPEHQMANGHQQRAEHDRHPVA